MKHMLFISVAGLLLALAAPHAQATPYQFSYEFNDGSILMGNLEGTLQGDNDTIFVDDFIDVFLDGVALPAITAGEIRSVSDFPNGGLQPQVSLSGSLMDVFVCAQGFNGGGNCSFANAGGFGFSTLLPLGFFAGAGDGQGGSSFDGGYTQARWSIASAQIDAPGSLGLMALALGLLVFGLRRFGRGTAGARN